MFSSPPKPLVLIILDGFGHSDNLQHNAIAAAHTPVYDRLRSHCAHGLIGASGAAVGLPDGQMGNSEVGHMNLGAGRVIYQDFTRITRAIEQGDFFTNPTLRPAMDKLAQTDNTLHILGLLSDGGVHSHQQHLLAMAQLAARAGVKNICLHAFLDGRDSAPKSARHFIDWFENGLSQLGCGRIASLIGRYFAMDRDHRWERVQKAWDLIVQGKAAFHAATASEGLQAAYARGESDEFVQATRIGQAQVPEDGDVVVFMNFRADRARELTRALTCKDFSGFIRPRLPQLHVLTLTHYADDIPAPAAFTPQTLQNTLGDWLAQHGKSQLRIAETEKYAHVTFFFSGGREQPFTGEERILIPSPKVATYDLQPEMSAAEVTDRIVDSIENQRHDVIVVNYANGDMVGHSGVFAAAVKAVECLDGCLGKIAGALARVGGEALITADHGNVEQMQDSVSGQPHTAHTCQPVPFIYLGKQPLRVRDGGTLADVAPTLLHLLGLEKPAQMSGNSLLVAE